MLAIIEVQVDAAERQRRAALIDCRVLYILYHIKTYYIILYHNLSHHITSYHNLLSRWTSTVPKRGNIVKNRGRCSSLRGHTAKLDTKLLLNTHTTELDHRGLNLFNS